ncbi:MAG TPA: hypothetical protein VHB20_13550 [Verrucomicrobiae bacterium]|jgi:hypothetical protein|nr:hypothetical protein [Verrucomicrobiae bacterium]
MRKPLKMMISLTVLFGASADFINSFLGNDSVAYFRSRPANLLLVVAVAVLGGGIFAFYSHLSASAKRRAILVLACCAAGIVSVLAISLTQSVIRLAVELWMFPSWEFVSGIASATFLSAFFWFWFLRTLRAPINVNSQPLLPNS